MPATWTAVLWLDDIATVDHSALGAARLLWQYRGSQPRLQGALDAWLTDIQSIEDVSIQVLTEVWPLTAVGVQLDNIGKIVQQERGELSDAAYRIMILGRILVNLSNGKVEELIEILDTVGIDISNDIFLDEFWPAEFRVDVVAATYGLVIGDLVIDWHPGGVSTMYVWNDQAEEDCFAMGDTLGADEVNVTGGFGDLGGVTQTTGGQFSGSQRS